MFFKRSVIQLPPPFAVGSLAVLALVSACGRTLGGGADGQSGRAGEQEGAGSPAAGGKARSGQGGDTNTQTAGAAGQGGSGARGLADDECRAGGGGPSSNCGLSGNAGTIGSAGFAGAAGQHGCSSPLPLTALQPLPVGRQPLWVGTADFDGDGAIDLATSSQVGGTVSALFGRGDGSFESSAPFAAGLGAYTGQGAVADLNEDGRADIAVVNESAVSILVNRGNRSESYSTLAGSAHAAPGRRQALVPSPERLIGG